MRRSGAAIAAASTLAFFVLFLMLAAAITDTLSTGTGGDQSRMLLRIGLYFCYVGGAVLAVGGLALFIKRIF